MASGNVAGVCFSRWKGRAVVRNTWTGTDPGTSKQLSQRAKVTQFSNRWGTVLTAEQRAAWNELARHMQFPDRFGDYRKTSGYQLYLRRNIIRKPDYTGYLDVPTEGGESFWTNYVIATWQSAYNRVLLQFYQVRTGSNHEGCQYWRAGPFETEARNPTAAEWEKIDYKVPCAHNHDYGIVAGKWYWYRGRATWGSGVVSSWWEWQEPTF